MTLVPGTRLGPYEILSALGAGGMGEVYRARDTRLDRTVAIKILPTELASDPDLRVRFDREARAISQLSHPHICTLYDVGHDADVHFLVLEYLEGETLEDRLARSNSAPLQYDDALRIGIEIAGALAAAHRAGIIHRDLKPGNVMLTKAGAKLLDFGLAKTAPPAVATSGLSMLPTTPPVAPQGGALTAQGTILGTFQYMAPEQIEGLEADARTDVFAFGCVLYEILTGLKAFEGKTRASLLGAILKDEPPPVSRAQTLASAELDRVVSTCLQKDPDDRWQTARDLLRELQWSVAAAPAAAAAASESSPRGAMRLERAGWVAGIIVAVVATFAGARAWRSSPAGRAMRFVIQAPPDVSLELGLSAMSVSRDGRLVAFRGSTAAGGTPQLFLRHIDQFDAAPIRGTEGAVGPFFSPDGQWLGFFADAKLKKVPVAGGPPFTICDAPGTLASRGAAWGPDDTIVFPAQTTAGLSGVAAAGGPPTPLTTLNATRGERSHRWPEFLPGGKAILFVIQSGTAASSFDDATIAVRSLETGQQRTVIAGGTRPRFASTGHVIFERGGSLLAVPFDANRLESTGPAFPVVEGVISNAATGLSHYDIAQNGTLVYAAGNLAVLDRTLAWVDRKGLARDIPGLKKPFTDVALSPDGHRAALPIGGSQPGDIWISDLDRGTLTRLTTTERGRSAGSPVWTADGHRVAYSLLSTNGYQMYWRSSDFSGPEEQLLKDDASGQFPRSFSPDGRWLLYQRGFNAATNDLWILPLEGDRKPRPFVATSFNETAARLSPDGRWVAYESNETGRSEIYVQHFPGPGAKSPVSTGGGARPTWASNGGEIFYRSGDRMMAVPVTLQPSFSAGTPHLLFESTYEPQYDVAPDGKQFLMIKGERQARPTTLNVVVDWFAEVAARAPAKR
jgi:Tol biopolymer transport system component